MITDKSDARILAVAGKGGVGKTSLAAVMVKLLVAAYPDKRILAIDADRCGIVYCTRCGRETHGRRYSVKRL